MLKLVNKTYSQHHVLKESQTLCSGTIQLHKLRPKFHFTDPKFEFEFPEDLDTLKDKDGTR